MPQQIIFNIGVSGSGKTTWTTDFIKNNPNYLRINRDDIRKTLVGDLNGYYKRSDLKTIEDIVSITESYIIVEGIRKDYSLIFDNTHLKSAYIKDKIELLEYWSNIFNKNLDIKFKIFGESDRNLLKQRVMPRDGLFHTAQVGYIDKQVSQLPGIIKYIEENYKNQIINE